MIKNKKFPKLLLYTLVSAIVVFWAMLILRKNTDKNIQISKPTWQCEYIKYSWSCDVQFTIKNNTHIQQAGKIGIRGINIKRSRKLNFDELSDVTYVHFSLNEYEEKPLKGTITAKREPKKVNLTFIEKEAIN